MKKTELIIMALAVLLSFNAHSQSFGVGNRSRLTFLNDNDEDEPQEDTIRGFSFGLNLGGYFANAATASIYNGSGPIKGFLNEASGVRLYSVDERIGTTSGFINDIQTINTYYNSNGYHLPNDSYPTNMRYNPAFYVGLQLKYNFDRYRAVIMNINALNLNATSQFTIQFEGTPQPLNAQADVRLFTIVGKEQRMNMNLGFRQGWMMGDFSNFYIQLGGSVLASKWKDNFIVVAGNNYNLVTSAPVQGQTQMTAQAQAGLGFGGYAALGIEFWLGKYSFDLGFGFSRDKVVLFDYEKNVWNKWLQASFTI